MPLSDDEQRKLRELEADAAAERHLVKLARQLSSASVYTGLRRVTVVWIAGGSTGLILVIAGAAVHSSPVLAAGVIVLAATMLVVGVAAIGVELTGFRRERHPDGGRPPRPPST